MATKPMGVKLQSRRGDISLRRFAGSFTSSNSRPRCTPWGRCQRRPRLPSRRPDAERVPYQPGAGLVQCSVALAFGAGASLQRPTPDCPRLAGRPPVRPFAPIDLPDLARVLIPTPSQQPVGADSGRVDELQDHLGGDRHAPLVVEPRLQRDTQSISQELGSVLPVQIVADPRGPGGPNLRVAASRHTSRSGRFRIHAAISRRWTLPLQCIVHRP